MIHYRTLDFLGFLGYRIGTDGSFWSRLRRVYGKGRRGNFRTVLGDTWRLLRPVVSTTGRRVVTLYCSDRRVVRSVSRLVLLAFIGPCPRGMECCHNNGVSQDDRLENLRWDTHSANLMDRVEHGTCPHGVSAPSAKLDETKVRDLRRQFASGDYTKKELGRIYNISDTAVGYIVRRKTWKYLD